MSDSSHDADAARKAAAATRRNTRLLRWVMQAAGIAALKNEATAAARRMGQQAALSAAAGILWLMVAAFVFGAFMVWLSGQIGAIPACAVVAGVLAIGAVILQSIAGRMAHRHGKWHLSAPFPKLSEAVRSGALDDSALAALAVLALAGLFIGFRGSKH